MARFYKNKSQACLICRLMGTSVAMRFFVLGNWLAICLLLRESCEKAVLALCASTGWITHQRVCAKTKKKKMKAFIINMIILFYFPEMT